MVTDKEIQNSASPATIEGRVGKWGPFALVAAVAAILFTLRLTAPPNLLDQDQERPAAYMLDAVKNGNWLCQRDLFGDITSKPPLYTWLGALTTLAFGRINLFALYLPGALSALGVAWLLVAVGRKYFGTKAAVLGAMAAMICTAGLKEFGLARTDGLFAFTVTAAALLAFRAWTLGKGWTWFWLLAAAATLTKGPLGLVLAAAGLAAGYWERRTKTPLPARGARLPGIILYFAICGGWFLLAYWQRGQPLIAKMLGKELVQHAVVGRGLPGTLIYQQPLYYLGRSAPWSLLAYYGLWRIWKYPAAAEGERRFERFLFCWFLIGLLIFSIAPHQRADHLWPIMPAAALIAGRELARLTQRIRPPVFNAAFVAMLIVAIGGFALYYFGPRARTTIIRQTVGLKSLARELERRGGWEFPVTHVDDRMAFQVYLNTLRPQISFERAAQLLRGEQAAFLAVDNLASLNAARRPDDPPMYTVLADEKSSSPTRILSNRASLALEGSFAFCFGSISIRAFGAKLVSATEEEFCFEPGDKPAHVIVTNEYTEPRKIRVCAVRAGRHFAQERILKSGESWPVAFDQRVATAQNPRLSLTRQNILRGTDDRVSPQNLDLRKAL